MGNQGKVQRVIRELVATLVEELGPDEAAHRLEMAVAKLRGAGHGNGHGNGHGHGQTQIHGHSPKPTLAHDERTAPPKPRIVVNS